MAEWSMAVVLKTALVQLSMTVMFRPLDRVRDLQNLARIRAI
jgi:hypothetical protein